MHKFIPPFLFLVIFSNAFAQHDTSNAPIVKDKYPIIMAAGKQYKATAWKQLWWGKHYRKEWTTPVGFQVLSLETYDGGLKPLKAGGGHQTKTLRLMSGNGKEYVLRTIDKSLDVLIPDELKGTVINDLVNDQISTAHPYGPLAISSMAGDLSLMHTNPVIFYVPDTPALEEFRSVFANKLCLLEERPSGDGWAHTPFSRDADDIVNTEKMLEKASSNTKNSVDQLSFLKVRLFDMIINDWDRHEDQWVWTVKKNSDNTTYTAFGRDRDQAFSKTDGLALFFLAQPWGLRPLQNISPSIKDLRGANFSARNLDRAFLNEITKDEWAQTIATVQSQLTDAAIVKGVNTMPAEVNKISGDFLIKRLEQRRDNLNKYGMKYYSILTRQVYINGSEKNEQFIIDSKKENEIAITGLRANKDTFYHRTFYRNETKEINIYGLEGDDDFTFSGSGKNKFKIHVVGGDGNDHYISSRTSKGGRHIKLYDSLRQEYDHKAYVQKRNWDTVYAYHRKSVKYDWYIPLIVPGYNIDDGVTIGIGLLYKRQQWGKTPYGWQQRILIDYATGTSSVGFGYRGIFKQTFGKWDFDLAAYYKGPRYTFNYYGFGNETILVTKEKSFYRVKANDFMITPGVSRTWAQSSFRTGLQFESVDVIQAQNKFITSPSANIDPSVFTKKNFGGVNGEWLFANTASEKKPMSGVHLKAGFSYLTNLKTTATNLLKLYGSLAFYHTFFNALTFAHRTGAATNFGDFEFYQANTLGANENLRGYWRGRFEGKSSLYQNTELRLKFAKLKGYVLRGEMGLFGFFDDGRVWIENEKSTKLHTGYGGGLYFLPYNALALTLYYATSKETSMMTLSAGFYF